MNPKPYETFEFCGQTRYRCPECPYDTYTEELLEKHIREHRVSAPQSSPAPTLFDFRGEAVKGEVDE